MGTIDGLKHFGAGAAHTILGTGLATASDFLWELTWKIDSPFADIAAGSGLAGGYNIGQRKVGGIAASLIGFVGSNAPYIAEALQNRSFTYLGAKLVFKTLEYSVGAVFGYMAGTVDD
ncbi:MAG TPA: hypothetical protein VJJ76_00605 [archaeon]|nr:hypothetical protein [archaeon]